jgi:hypothetical protein
MSRFSAACVLCAALLLLVSCGPKSAGQGTRGPAGTAAVSPIIDTSKAKDIDAQLAKYDEVVTRYLADTSGGTAEATDADTAELATVSEALSTLAADFNADQLAKYNAITARLSE